MAFDFLIPSFCKTFSVETCLESLKVPHEWVHRHGRNLPHNCTLIMQNRRRWVVRLVQVENGFYFRSSWNEFVRQNFLAQADFLAFHYVGGGEFQVYRFNSFSGCPSRPDYDASLTPAYESDVDLYPDVKTSDDFDTSDEEAEDRADDHDLRTSVARFPSVMDHLHHSALCFLQRTSMARWYIGCISQNYSVHSSSGNAPRFLEAIPIPSVFPCKAYFTVHGSTWEMQVANTRGKIRIKRGWSLFKRRNSVGWGMTLHFLLSDINGIHFYVLIKA
ncbi:hypothetical protein SASPL_131430 [Salvia splendens]|uniref:TF-B3 domain-containing protein n=1 Tax=Salvia splendens TaxID=180675 RepID=A0A8X8ZLK6_SALSN|nr:hypothetical protein SASPL_131430 [Salvia splendens]